MYGLLLYILFSLLGGERLSMSLRHVARWALILLYVVLGSILAMTVSASFDLSQDAVVVLWYGTLGGLIALMLIGPGWLAWRVLGPRGWMKAGRAFLAWSCVGRRLGDWHGEAVLFRVAFEREPPDLRSEPADAWMAIALVVAAERRGDLDRARMLAGAFDDLPQQALLSRRLRKAGIELFALGAARRGDWKDVARRARRGLGRGARFLLLLARENDGGNVWPPALWLARNFSPWRRESRAWNFQEPAEVERTAMLPLTLDPGTGPWRQHVHLLASAVAASSVPIADVLRLAETWEEALDRQREAEWLARGLELEARAPGDAWDEIRSGVLRELDLLLDAAHGAWPAWPKDGPELAAELLQRRRHRMLETLIRWTDSFPNDGGVGRPLRPPLEEWEDWITFRGHVLRLAAACGKEALETAWHNGVRLTACNWPVHLHRVHGPRARWAAWVMYLWSSWLATWVGDEEIKTLSQKNLQIVARQAAE